MLVCYWAVDDVRAAIKIHLVHHEMYLREETASWWPDCLTRTPTV